MHTSGWMESWVQDNLNFYTHGRGNEIIYNIYRLPRVLDAVNWFASLVEEFAGAVSNKNSSEVKRQIKTKCKSKVRL